MMPIIRIAGRTTNYQVYPAVSGRAAKIEYCKYLNIIVTIALQNGSCFGGMI